jgi:chromosome segregation ATPase
MIPAVFPSCCKTNGFTDFRKSINEKLELKRTLREETSKREKLEKEKTDLEKKAKDKTQKVKDLKGKIKTLEEQNRDNAKKYVNVIFFDINRYKR